jgi:phage-related protein
MAEKTVALTITTDSKQAEASVGSFKKQLKEANNELLNMSAKFGEASTEAVNAAKKVAHLKDAIGDAKALADTFNPDKKFVALGGALQGVTAGFSALQGAIGLFGDENKDLEKTLLKVQSAMALQQGISGLMEAKDSFGLLKDGAVRAFNAIKGAIGSTGIGLLVLALFSLGLTSYFLSISSQLACNALVLALGLRGFLFGVCE